MLTLHERGCDKFITLIRMCDKFITLTNNARFTLKLYLRACDKFITLTNSAKSNSTVLFAKAARRPPWRVPIRLDAKKSLRKHIQTSVNPHVQASTRPGIHTCRRLSSICPYFQASTRLYFYTLRRLHTQAFKCRDVYTPGCEHV